MARMNISLPDQMAEAAKAAGLSVSQLARRAITEELAERDRLLALDRYLDQLDAELGPPTEAESAMAEEWGDRVFGPRGGQRSA